MVGDQEQGRIHPPGGVQLARGVFAVPVDGRGLDPQLPGDLFGVHVRVDEPKTLAFAVGQSISTARHQRPPAQRAT